MFRDFSINLRFAVATAVAIVIVLSVGFGFTFQYTKEMLSEAEQESLNELADNILNEVDSEGRRAQSMAALVAEIPQVQKAFAERDRETLQSFFAKGFAKLKKDYGARQFQFHEPPATSFLRVHKLAKFGDDLSGFRHTVVETNRSLKPIKGLEVGVAGLGVRGIAPVFHNDKHVGSVEFGMSFGQSFFDRVSEKHGIDLSLDIQRDQQITTFATTMAEDSLMDTQEKQQVLAEGALFKHGELSDKPVSVYATEVKNYSGTPIGVLTLAIDRSGHVDELSELRNIIIVLALLSTAILVLIVWLISRGVVQPLAEASDKMNEIAFGSGDLSDRLDETGKDEIASLTKAYNAFMGKIESTINHVVSTANDLAMMVNEFAELSDHTNKGIRRQKDQSTQVATAMTEMTATVTEVAQNTINTADAANDADQQSNHGQEIVKTAMDSINTLADEVERAVSTVRTVEEDSERIGTVLDVIRGIAEQTNLLALNAAIEAARAGEQGRGFAVVADEVRNLASRTQESTQEIQEMITSLQSGVNDTVTIMKTSKQQASDSVEQAAAAHEALVSITAAIDTITSMSSQIATAAEEQSVVAEDINRSIVDITDVAHQTADDSEKTSEATTHLASSVEQLVALMGQFKTGNQYANELNRAKASHLAWKGKVRSFLDGRGALDEHAAFSHHQCGFGKWYDTVGISELGHMPEFKQIEPSHMELHETIKQIVHLKNQGDVEGAERAFEKIAPLSQKIVGLIDQLEKQVSN